MDIWWFIWTSDLYGRVHNAFDSGKSITRASPSPTQCSKFFLSHCPPPPPPSAVNFNRTTNYKSTGNCNVPTHIKERFSTKNRFHAVTARDITYLKNWNMYACPFPENSPLCPFPKNTPFCPFPKNASLCPFPKNGPLCPFPKNTPFCPFPKHAPLCPFPKISPLSPFTKNTPLWTLFNPQKIAIRSPYFQNTGNRY